MRVRVRVTVRVRLRVRVRVGVGVRVRVTCGKKGDVASLRKNPNIYMRACSAIYPPSPIRNWCGSSNV